MRKSSPLRPLLFLSALAFVVVGINDILISGAEKRQHRSVAITNAYGEAFLKEVTLADSDVKIINPDEDDKDTVGEKGLGEAVAEEAFFVNTGTELEDFKKAITKDEDSKEITPEKIAIIAEKGLNKEKIVTKKALPSFAHGGVIVWLHVPKTGGTSIRKSFQGRKDVSYLFSNRRPRYDSAVEQVDEWVANGTKDQTVGILEVHARNNPSLLEMCDQLQQWRETAQQNNVPFFAFTLYREPLSFSISYFNYYHGVSHEKRRFEYLPEEQMTEENYRQTMHFNPQCLFLARGEQAYQRNFPEKRLNLTQAECDQAYECMKTNMDWIGTTERLQNETMPLLNHLIGRATTEAHQASIEEEPLAKHENTGPRIFGRSDISSLSMEYVRNMTRWDAIMYQHVMEEYNFEDYDLPVQ